MVELFDPKRLEVIKSVVENSNTEIQFNNRKEIALRLRKLTETCGDDEEFYARAWNDFPVWCAAFIDDDSGLPLFPAPWQTEYALVMAQRKYVWAFCSRKVGKSTMLSAKNLHDVCGLVPKRLICFAPTLGQDFVFDKMGTYLSKSPYLYGTFIENGGAITQDYIEISNNSSVQNRTIGIANKGELVRGEYGDIVTVDEIQKIEESVMRQVIEPIIADAYSEKKFRMIGTPNSNANPNLEKEWRAWKRDSQLPNSEYGYMVVDWKRGVAEGCLNEKYVLKRREKMTPDEFAMEFEARFPEQGSRFYDLNLLDAKISHIDKFRPAPRPDFRYAMAVDYAKFSNRTQIVVGEYDSTTRMMRYVHWREIDPKREPINYEQQIEIVKEIFWNYNCEWICPDATSNQDALIRMLIMGYKPVPEGRIYKTGERTGYCATDVLNDHMWRNHREMMVTNRILVPNDGVDEHTFVEKWKKEHNELDVKYIRNGQMIKLEEPRNGYKDLAVACGMLSLWLETLEVTKASLEIGAW